MLRYTFWYDISNLKCWLSRTFLSSRHALIILWYNTTLCPCTAIVYIHHYLVCNNAWQQNSRTCVPYECILHTKRWLYCHWQIWLAIGTLYVSVSFQWCWVCVCWSPNLFACIHSHSATNLQKDLSRREDIGTYIKGTYWHMIKPKSFLIT